MAGWTRFIIRHRKFFYLFASFDGCCQGAKSNYNIRVGRAKEITGPYVDASGKAMLEGGGTMVLESAGRKTDLLLQGAGKTNIFIYPPFQFRWVDALLTNFHLPRSTLLMLVSAFASPCQTRGRELILRAYHKAIHERYRFFSYGDAMLLL